MARTKHTANKATPGRVPRKQPQSKRRRHGIGAAGGCANVACIALPRDREHIDSMPAAVANIYYLSDASHGASSYNAICSVLAAFQAGSPHYIYSSPLGWLDHKSRIGGLRSLRLLPPDIKKDMLNMQPTQIPSGQYNAYLSMFDSWQNAVKKFPGEAGTFGFFLVTGTTGNWVQEPHNSWPGRHCYALVVHRLGPGENHLYIFEPDAEKPEDLSNTTLSSFGAIQIIPRQLVQPRDAAITKLRRFSFNRVFIRQLGEEDIAQDGRCVARTLEWMSFAAVDIEAMIKEREHWFWEPPNITFTPFNVADAGVADRVLCGIRSGDIVGFDSEFVSRTQRSPEAQRIQELLGEDTGKHYDHWQQVLAVDRGTFQANFDTMSLRLVQLAFESKVYVFDLKKMKVLPAELRRILCSKQIIKAGFGTNRDVEVLWQDLGIELNGMVDVGVMARIHHAAEGKDLQSMGMSSAAQLDMQYEVQKDMQQSDWAVETLSLKQKQYAAIDGVLSLELYRSFDAKLNARRLGGAQIAESLYSFHSRFGGPIRIYEVGGKPVKWNACKQCHWFYRETFIGYQGQ
ncbi:ribonuclease H-like domain-containing protein [Mycena amicta]|nr:ribonuclease H-like domain-containing protein [Mycena amicta]